MEEQNFAAVTTPKEIGGILPADVSDGSRVKEHQTEREDDRDGTKRGVTSSDESSHPL